jgi:hypothetical protein
MLAGAADAALARVARVRAGIDVRGDTLMADLGTNDKVGTR